VLFPHDKGIVLLPVSCFVAGQVSLQGLLNGLGGIGSKSLLALKKRLATAEERIEPLEPPLNKIEADRVREEGGREWETG
jgi:hypothetical protein